MELTEIILAQAVSLDLTFVASLPNIDRQLVPNSCYTFNARHLAWWMVEYPLSHPFLHDDDLVAYQADPRETFGHTTMALICAVAGRLLSWLCDRFIFSLLLDTGLRVSEELSLYVENLNLSLDNEHLTVERKGGKRRTVLLDDRGPER